MRWKDLPVSKCIPMSLSKMSLTSKRPYKEAWPLERAIELLVSERNEHFDPRIVDLFVASRSEMERIFYEHQEE